MPQPRQAEVGTRPVEQCQRPRGIGRCVPHAVRNFISDMDQLIRRKEAGKLGRADVTDLDPAVLDHIGVRDLARRAADADLDVIVANQVLDLVDEIFAEQVWARDAGGIGAGLAEARESARRRRAQRLAAIVDPELRISEAPLVPRLGIGPRPVADVLGQRLAEVGDGLVLDGGEVVDDAARVEFLVHPTRLERLIVACKWRIGGKAVTDDSCTISSKVSSSPEARSSC